MTKIMVLESAVPVAGEIALEAMRTVENRSRATARRCNEAYGVISPALHGPDYAVVVEDRVQRQVVRLRLKIIDKAIGKAQAHGKGARL